ncbi:hypothetical protein KFQ04_07745 [Pseudomonas synxantha]|nr:hypothetical protein KFQ04_07745 [Pseudomonas synxantha]
MSLSISTPTGSHRSSVNSYSQTRGKSANNTSSSENKLLSSHLLRAVPTETSATHVMSGKDRGAPPSNLWTGLYATYEKYPYFGRYDHDDWVAVIKAAMSGLGQSPLSIFDEVKDTGNGYNITMKDDFKLHISNDELALATHHAKFAGDDEGMLKDARFIFAIMNKRKHLEAQYNYRKIDYRTHIHQHSFGAVLSSSDYGISGYEGLKLLGLDYQLQHVWSQDVGNQVAVPAMKVFSSKRGMINDGFMENYGHKKKVPQWIESFIVLKAPTPPCRRLLRSLRYQHLPPSRSNPFPLKVMFRPTMNFRSFLPNEMDRNQITWSPGFIRKDLLSFKVRLQPTPMS